jgi:hypothetical protein
VIDADEGNMRLKSVPVKRSRSSPGEGESLHGSKANNREALAGFSRLAVMNAAT